MAINALRHHLPNARSADTYLSYAFATAALTFFATHGVCTFYVQIARANCHRAQRARHLLMDEQVSQLNGRAPFMGGGGSSILSGILTLMSLWQQVNLKMCSSIYPSIYPSPNLPLHSRIPPLYCTCYSILACTADVGADASTANRGVGCGRGCRCRWTL